MPLLLFANLQARGRPTTEARVNFAGGLATQRQSRKSMAALRGCS